MQKLPMYSDMKSDAILSYLSQSLRLFVHKAGYTKVVLGLSGGIDSALVLAIATHALGKENVHTIFMPSLYTTSESKQCVRELVDVFDVELSVMPIHSLLMLYTKEYENMSGEKVEGVALENLQSRIRSTILMTYSNINHSLVLATGNKSELSVGYCTLYGDTCGAVAPIGDIYKTHVYILAKRYGIIYSKVMPELLFTKSPSAELAYNQYDEDRLPPYPILDTILYAIEQGDVLDATICEEKYIEQTKKLYESALFKKQSYPPVFPLCGIFGE